MILQRFECPQGHQEDRMVPGGTDSIRCLKCKRKASILWEAYSPQYLKDPVLIFKMADGSYSFPGSSRARTPKGATRMELRKPQEVRAVMKEYNASLRSQEERKEERYMEHAQAQQDERRRALHHLMGQESDPTARQLYRDALDQAKLQEAPRFREFYHEMSE